MTKQFQYGFRPNDCSIQELIAIKHDIFTTFGANPSLEVRGFFIHLSKVFDRVWHKELPYKLKCKMD